MNDETAAIIDAAVEVAHFSKSHTWPAENSPEFFEFAQKLDALSTAIAVRFPHFERNLRTAKILQTMRERGA